MLMEQIQQLEEANSMLLEENTILAEKNDKGEQI